jgi:uncharacterized protein YjbI with pentapeptide repeats
MGEAMANEEQVAILKQGVVAWNRWRSEWHSKKTMVEYITKRENNHIDLRGAHLTGADLGEVDLRGADLREADLRLAYLRGADLSEANLMGANLEGALLGRTNLRNAFLNNTNLMYADLTEADLTEAHLGEANLQRAQLFWANLRKADLTEADLREAYMSGACLLEAAVYRTKISGSNVYGINVWSLHGEFDEQKDLVISRADEPLITVDNVEVAQFIYLILNNKKIRNVIDTLTSRAVLILGRFTKERKVVLDALKSKLRDEHKLLPIIFDFERSTDRDFTETIKTLAGLSCFVIADITNPSSSPLELQATVPDYHIPFVPIIQEGERPFAMMADLQKTYPWVLETVSYSSIETLMKALKPAIIDRAFRKHEELRLLKAREPRIISASDFIDNKD